MDRWLLINDGPATGAENMATDEFLLARAEREGGDPILRMYSFHPPAITIGYHQEIGQALDLEAVSADSIDVARRVTGGRALLHDGEITYCFAAPNAALRGRARAGEIFLAISQALCSALRSVGVRAEVSRGRQEGRLLRAAAPCLLSTSRYELTAGGKKIAGSARRAMRDAFLQHGSILLGPGSARMTRYARGPWGSLDGRITSVSEELGGSTAEQELRVAIPAAFAEAFGVEWVPYALSTDDRCEVRRIASAKESEFSDAREQEASRASLAYEGECRESAPREVGS